MLRAISEIAVAMSVGSGRGNPSRSAIARPSARAVTRSASELIATRTSSLIARVPVCWAAEERPCGVEVQRGAERLEVQAELHHRDRDVGLDADDHGLGAAEPRAQHDRPQRAGYERVD